jgi:hypothetical protein
VLQKPLDLDAIRQSRPYRLSVRLNRLAIVPVATLSYLAWTASATNSLSGGLVLALWGVGAALILSALLLRHRAGLPLKLFRVTAIPTREYRRVTAALYRDLLWLPRPRRKRDTA